MSNKGGGRDLGPLKKISYCLITLICMVMEDGALYLGVQVLLYSLSKHLICYSLMHLYIVEVFWGYELVLI